ncbi:MAG: hypothetical protein AB7S38_33690 [Vulcanimicrobiota bacterium]
MQNLIRRWTLCLLILVLGIAWAQPPNCTCPPGSSTTTPTGISAPPSLDPGRVDPDTPDQPGASADEESVGDFSNWVKDHPDSPIAALANQANNDPALNNVLNQLTPSELGNLGDLLTKYQNGINGYVKANPRVFDGAPGGLRNFFNSFSGDTFTRGCADMSDKTLEVLGPQTGGSNPFTVHSYSWDPGAGRQYGAYFGAPIGGIIIVKMAAGGTALGGPLGTLVGGTTGLIVALGTRNTEHNMAALQSTRNPKLVIILDPHAAQSGNPDSVHGPDHYNGVFSQPALGPAKVPATPAADAQPTIQRGTMTR